jgi:cellulose synthase/poly-beta-1,6-N-acetylglucosamine synthase-like glycosyltransferase
VYDLLEGCRLQLATIPQWFGLGNLAKLGRGEFVAGFEQKAERAVLAHPPHRLPEESKQAATPVEGLVTVIVPTLNEEAAIDACLRTIRSQTCTRLEILVIDGESSDRTREIVMSHAADDERLRLILNPDRVIPAALNRALWAASGQWLVRVDAHATIPQDYVDRLIKHLATGRWGGVGGRKDGASTEPMGRAIAVALGSPFGVGNSVYHHGTTTQVVDHLAYGAYPSEVARSIGGWNERLVANEDYEFDYRVQEAGYQLLFDPAIKVRWVSQQRLRNLGRQYRRYGRAKAQVMQIRPESTKLRHLVAPALVGWTAAAALVGLRRPWFGAAMMVPYTVGVAAATGHSAQTVPPSVAIRTAPAFVTMHFAWGAGWWERMVLRRQAAGSTARHRPAGQAGTRRARLMRSMPKPVRIAR